MLSYFVNFGCTNIFDVEYVNDKNIKNNENINKIIQTNEQNIKFFVENNNENSDKIIQTNEQNIKIFVENNKENINKIIKNTIKLPKKSTLTKILEHL